MTDSTPADVAPPRGAGRPGRRSRSAAPGRVGRWVLLVTALAQAASPAVAGFDQGSSADPVVVPPGPFFAVWGVVLLGCLAVAVRGLDPRRAATADLARLHLPLSLVQVGFVVWLLLAAAAPVASVPVFAAMLVLLVVALRAAPVRRADAAGHGDGGRRASRPDGLLVEVTLGVYAGWTAAAVWVNTATVLDAPSSLVLALLLVGAVTILLVLVLLVARTATARTAAGLTGAWALLGVALSTAGAGATVLVVLAAAGAAAVLTTALVGAHGAHAAR